MLQEAGCGSVDEAHFMQQVSPGWTSGCDAWWFGSDNQILHSLQPLTVMAAGNWTSPAVKAAAHLAFVWSPDVLNYQRVALVIFAMNILVSESMMCIIRY